MQGETKGHPRLCENCATPLHGAHCHACGQPSHNPLRHLGHAIEEVFESIWHLDGRVFRSLRDSCIPGRVINNYLAGQRVRYLPPLRLFVILSLLAFFLASCMVRGSGMPMLFYDGIANATTVAEVERVREQARADIEQQRAALPGRDTRGRSAALDSSEQLLQVFSEARIEEIRENQRQGVPVQPRRDMVSLPNGEQWHPQDNPLRVDWLPGFANGWINAALGRAESNMRRFTGDPSALVLGWLSSVPTALFFLVPVFALLLRIAYVGSDWRYLEHLVVALYSHSFILLASSVWMLLALLAHGIGWMPLVTGIELASPVLLVGIAVWLFLCQWRVYRQPLWLTALKFTGIGIVYTMLVSIGAMLLMALVLVR